MRTRKYKTTDCAPAMFFARATPDCSFFTRSLEVLMAWNFDLRKVLPSIEREWASTLAEKRAVRRYFRSPMNEAGFRKLSQVGQAVVQQAEYAVKARSQGRASDRAHRIQAAQDERSAALSRRQGW